MTTRILPRAEYGRLAGTALEPAVVQFPGARVIVAEADGVIVGHLMLAPMWHVEGFSVAPEYGGLGAGDLLIDAMHEEARAIGLDTVFPAAGTAGMARYITMRHGVEIPARWFAVAVRES